MFWTAALSGCIRVVAVDAGDPVDTAETTETSSTADPTEPPAGDPEFPGGLRIGKISAYQGVESILVEDGAPPTRGQVPLAAGRTTLVRVFLDPDRDFDSREITVLLTVKNGNREEVFQRTPFVRDASTDADLTSTVNFELDGALLEIGTELEVELRENDADAPGGGERKDAFWRGDDLDIDETGVLTVALIPIRYRYDGSNRLPDTSQAQVDRIQALTEATYPAKRVRVRVDRAVDWDGRISPLSSGDWSRVLNALAGERARADEEPNTYYYGMFNPEPTELDFCRRGCILGLSLLAQTPNDPYFRTSIGLGYPTPTTADTLVHEVGHAHGRNHAPCGLGGQPADRLYPYAGAEIGTWGWDVRDGSLVSPDRFVDMMSYCSPIWISDYTFSALYDRIRAVDRSPRAAAVTRRMFSYDAEVDVLEPLGDVTLAATSVGEPVTVRFTGPGGAVREVSGSLFRYPDVGGGLVALDEALPPGFVATLAD